MVNIWDVIAEFVDPDLALQLVEAARLEEIENFLDFIFGE